MFKLLLYLGTLLLVAGAIAVPAAGSMDMAPQEDSPAASDAALTLTWWTVDGGGISSATGGAYLLRGTAGQPDAAIKLTGGAYELRPGFWPGIAAPLAPGNNRVYLPMIFR